jgi:RNA polymerase sigma factor (sigma-70 family)
VQDSDIVASIVAGDPAGLTQAFDRHASALFAYCSAQLREPEDAAAVVRDTFRDAISQLAGLREPERLRPWLYAVARTRCRRLVESGEARSAVGMPPEEPAQLHALLRAALGGLSEGECDVALLRLWQGLDTDETALVLGISRRRVHYLLTRARGQLGTSLGALLVARTGRKGCVTLDALLTGWDGQFTGVVRNRLSRHIKRCTACTDRRRRELESTLLSHGPGTSLTRPAALTSVLKEAAGTANVPPWLRNSVLSANTDGTEAGVVPSHPGAFRKDGFPEPATQPQRRAWKMSLVPAIAVAAVVLAAMFIVLDPSFRGGSSVIGAPPGSGQRTAPGLQPSGRGGGVQPSGGGGGIAPTAGSTQNGPGPSGSAPDARHSSGVTVVSTSTVPATSNTGTGVPSAPSNSATAAPTGAPPTAAPSPSTAPSPTPSPGTTSAQTQGTLSVSPSTVALTLSAGGTITLTAENGPVSWSIAEPSSLLGELNVAPASGTLAAGQSTQVTISVSGLASLDTKLTVSPGGEQVTVLLGVGL